MGQGDWPVVVKQLQWFLDGIDCLDPYLMDNQQCQCWSIQRGFNFPIKKFRNRKVIWFRLWQEMQILPAICGKFVTGFCGIILWLKYAGVLDEVRRIGVSLCSFQSLNFWKMSFKNCSKYTFKVVLFVLGSFLSRIARYRDSRN